MGTVTIPLIFLCFSLMLMMILMINKLVHRNKNQIRLLKEEMAKVAEEAAREIVIRLFMGEDKPLSHDGWGGLERCSTEAQEQVRKFVTKCIVEGVESSEAIMKQINERNADLIKFVKYWDSEEFIKLLIAKINEYQLQ